jgi:carbon storage regulator CsrA
MLLVARRVGEALRIGTNIEVKVVAATRSRVMLAVTAPRELEIRRIYGKADYKNEGEAPVTQAEPASESPSGHGTELPSRKKTLPTE